MAQGAIAGVGGFTGVGRDRQGQPNWGAGDHGRAPEKREAGGLGRPGWTRVGSEGIRRGGGRGTQWGWRMAAAAAVGASAREQ